MARFGWNPFPRRFGGGKSTLQIEHEALLDALAPGWDTAWETESNAELYAHALAVTMIWQVNNRLRQQAIPLEMLENLKVWEQVLRLNPTREDTLNQRRSLVAARMRGLAGNSLVDLRAAISLVAGNMFVELRAPAFDAAWAFWPGINPGPPGWEWTSNRAITTIVLVQTGVSGPTFYQTIGKLVDTVSLQAPAWLGFNIGTDSGAGFIVNEGIVGRTFI